MEYVCVCVSVGQEEDNEKNDLIKSPPYKGGYPVIHLFWYQEV